MKGSTKLTLFCAIFLALCYTNAYASKCGPNQYYSSCGTNCPANCDVISPTSCNFACNFNQYCFCKPGYVERSATNKTCIPWESCPQNQCGPNQRFTTCGTNCPTTCANPRPKTCNRRCNPNQHCFCKYGYVQRSETDLTCVPKRSCLENQCGENQIYRRCGTNCPATCANPEPRACNRACNLNQHCFCKRGYVQRSKTDQTCIPKQSCPNICELEPEPGHCLGFFMMYYYNKESRSCEPFIYGGCQGNANRFGSYADCMTKCSK